MTRSHVIVASDSCGPIRQFLSSDFYFRQWVGTRGCGVVGWNVTRAIAAARDGIDFALYKDLASCNGVAVAPLDTNPAASLP
jgi:hypothetical protein